MNCVPTATKQIHNNKNKREMVLDCCCNKFEIKSKQMLPNRAKFYTDVIK